MDKKIKKICIVGGSGSGKTTLANNLGRVLDLPVYYIDAMHHTKNWSVRDKNERDKMIEKAANTNKWIIDGTYHSTFKMRSDKADLIIFLDYPTITRLRGIIGRYLKHPGKEREDIPGCRERLTFTFLKASLSWKKQKRNKIIESIKNIDKSKVLIFKNRRQLNKWFYNEFKEKIS